MIKKVPVKRLRLPSWLSSESLFVQAVHKSSQLGSEFGEFSRFFYGYNQQKMYAFSRIFEGNKNKVVKNVLIKRGKRNRMFLHVSAMGVLSVGVTISPLISDSGLLQEDQVNLTYAQDESESVLAPNDVFHTQESEKPRDEILEYTVQKGDTVSTIAKRFGVDDDTIRWENSLKNDSITVGDTIRILPVSGMAHKVSRGDTVYTIAKKYDANAQAIVDFPFNDFANPQTFSLIEGQIVIVPDGVKPEEAPVRAQRRMIAATGSESVLASGFAWPVRGTLNQYYSWYHRGIDIGAPNGTPMFASQNGVVSQVFTSGWNGGYGTHVIISGDNGYSTLYGHMSGISVGVGDKVAAGKTQIGWVGSTGRSTGPHIHLEIRGAAGLYDPMSFLR